MKYTIWFTALVLILTMGSMFLPVNGEEGIYDNAIRLHVLANSDSEEDQALKEKVRDRILEIADRLASECEDTQTAKELLSAHLTEICTEAEKVIRENGYNYPVTVTFDEEYYPTRDYEGLSLPAGEYLSLRVCIGEAEGKNWWCILFPPLCLNCSAPQATLKEAGFSPSQVEILTENEKPSFVLKFRILELLQKCFL